MREPDIPDAASGKPLNPAARRALEEAAGRRALARSQASRVDSTAPEQGGPRGLEPTRYGDWERKGRAVDF
jgi:hypothetical protein